MSASRTSHADVVAFPDDDCAYEQDVLGHVGRLLAREPELDGVTGRSVDRGGRSSPSWKRDPARLERRQPLEPRDLVHDLPSTRGRRARSEHSTSISASAPRSPGPPARRSTTSFARSGAERRIRVRPSARRFVHERRRSRKSGSATARRIGYLLRKHRYPGANRRADARAPGRRHRRVPRPARPHSVRASTPRTLRGRHPRLPRGERSKSIAA